MSPVRTAGERRGFAHSDLPSRSLWAGCTAASCPQRSWAGSWFWARSRFWALVILCGAGRYWYGCSVLGDDGGVDCERRHRLGEGRRRTAELRAAAVMGAPVAELARLGPEVALLRRPVDGPPQRHEGALEAGQLLGVG